MTVTRAVRSCSPQTRVVSRDCVHFLYTWTRVIILSDHTSGHVIPMWECAGIYRWKWMANWAGRRWLRRHDR